MYFNDEEKHPINDCTEIWNKDPEEVVTFGVELCIILGLVKEWSVI